MKTIGALLIGFFLVLTVKPNERIYPQVEKISFEDPKTFEETMQDTELYKKTLGVEDTINKTKELIQEIKDEDNRRFVKITKW